MIKKCRTCAAYCKVYSKLAFGYSPIVNVFYCTDRGEITERDNVCDNWRKRVKAEVDFSKKRFDDVERDILFIKNSIKLLK